MGKSHETPVLNWYVSEELVNGLLPLFEKGKRGKIFVTIRLGMDWADKLYPTSYVKISISDDQQKPNIIGIAQVWSVIKTSMVDIFTKKVTLTHNISAKTPKKVLEDMQSVYGLEKVHAGSLVTVITLLVDETLAFKKAQQVVKTVLLTKKMIQGSAVEKRRAGWEWLDSL